jgi:tetratricopeptide (TPR) repeat protein
MVRKLPLPFFLVLLIKTCFAQDTLVYYNEVTFTTPFEKQVLDEHFLAKKTDLFNLFMANGTILNESQFKETRQRFYNHVTKTASQPNLQNKKNDKKLKTLYDNLHETFLIKYDLKNKFENIFDNGYYNCVSASALYALAFENLGIPYVIKEKPTHVYLLAYPQNEKIVVETTSPTSAYNTLNDPFKTAYIKMLKEQKVISNAEYVGGDINALFDKYYFGEQEDISILNLVGIQYMNDGLFKLDDQKYIEAFHQLEKAYLFYPSKRMGYLLYLTLLHAIDASASDVLDQATYLGKFARFKSYAGSADLLPAEFERVAYKLLFEHSDRMQLNAYYQKIDSTLHDQETRDELASIYNYENARYLYSQGHYKAALPYLEKALDLKPNNLDVNNLFTATLGETFDNDGVSEESIKKMDGYAAKYKSLQENNVFAKLQGKVYLFQIASAYDLNKPAEGDKYRVVFENHMTKHADLSIENSFIGNAYSRAAVFYFRKGQTTKAKSIIEKGLTYAPNSNELLSRQRMIK